MIRAEHGAGTPCRPSAEAERAEGERRAKEEAQKRLAQIEKGTEILASVFRDLDPIAAEKDGVPLRVLLGRRLGEAARQLEGEAVGDPLVVARLQHVLGVSLRELGHLEQAEGVLVKACRTRERLLGADHLDTVATKHHLALLYRSQGKYDLAEALFKEVLAARTARLGADHPDTLTSQHHLALLYDSQRKYALAEALFKEVLAVRTARLGADHPDTLTSKHRLALLYRSQGKYDLAEALYKEVLAARTARLGADHLDTLATKDNLAALYRDQGKYALAEALFKEVLAVRTAKLGADHPDTLYSQHDLARLYHDQGKYDLAEALYKEVLAARTAKLGPTTPTPSTASMDLAMLYWSMKKLDQSIPLLEETLKRRRPDSTPTTPSRWPCRPTSASTTATPGDSPTPFRCSKKSTGRATRTPNGSWVVGNALLTAYVRTGKTTEATALATEQVRAAREQFPADSPWLGVALADTGKALLDAKAYDAAEPLLRESLSLGEKLGPDAWDTHHARSLLGGVLLGQQKYAAAEPLLLDGYEGLRRTQAGIVRHIKDMMLRDARGRLVQLYDAWDKPDEAAKWRKDLETAKE